MKNMTPSLLATFTRAQTRLLPEFEPITQILTCCNLIQRKTILTLSRCQHIPLGDATPSTDKTLRQLEQPLHTTLLVEGQVITLWSALLPIAHLFRDPVSSGYINMLSRNLPLLDEREYEQEIYDGVSKEISAAIQVYHPKTLVWDPMLNKRHPTNPTQETIHPSYPYSSQVYAQISYSFLGVINTLSKTVFYPATGTKTMGVIASKNYRQMRHYVQDVETNVDIATPKDCELMYVQALISSSAYNL
jgi:hypothetical protein